MGKSVAFNSLMLISVVVNGLVKVKRYNTKFAKKESLVRLNHAD